jgi:hypothetical protein
MHTACYTKSSILPRLYKFVTLLMPAIILIIGLVCLPLVVVGCLLTAYLKMRCAHVYDIERANSIDGTRYTNDDGMVLQDMPGISWPIGRDIVPTNIAPVAKPLPETKGVGGGSIKARGRQYEGFDEAQIHGNQHLPSTFATVSLPPVINIPDIQALQPTYTHASSGHYNATQDSAAEAWTKIEKRESLVETKRKSVPTELPMEDFEDFDLDDEDSGKEWRQDKRAATPGGVFAIGNSKDENNESRKHISNTPIAASPVTDVVSAVPGRVSWSTSSSFSIRRASDVTHHSLPESLSRASSMREECATSSRKGSVVSRLTSLQRSPSDRSRRSSAAVDRKGRMGTNQLVGYADSDEE